MLAFLSEFLGFAALCAAVDGLWFPLQVCLTDWLTADGPLAEAFLAESELTWTFLYGFESMFDLSSSELDV